MTAAVRRLHVSGHELKGDGGLAYGWGNRCGPPVPARCGPWTPRAWWPGSGSGGHSGRRLAGPVRVAAGAGPPPWLLTVAQLLASAV